MSNGNIYASVLDPVVAGVAIKATKYMSPTKVIRATRLRYKSMNGRFNKDRIEIVFSVGRPNYLEREFVNQCKKAGEPFPVRKVQIKPYVVVTGKQMERAIKKLKSKKK